MWLDDMASKRVSMYRASDRHDAENLSQCLGKPVRPCATCPPPVHKQPKCVKSAAYDMPELFCVRLVQKVPLQTVAMPAHPQDQQWA